MAYLCGSPGQEAELATSIRPYSIQRSRLSQYHIKAIFYHWIKNISCNLPQRFTKFTPLIIRQITAKPVLSLNKWVHNESKTSIRVVD